MDHSLCLLLDGPAAGFSRSGSPPTPYSSSFPSCASLRLLSRPQARSARPHRPGPYSPRPGALSTRCWCPSCCRRAPPQGCSVGARGVGVGTCAHGPAALPRSRCRVASRHRFRGADRARPGIVLKLSRVLAHPRLPATQGGAYCYHSPSLDEKAATGTPGSLCSS